MHSNSLSQSMMNDDSNIGFSESSQDGSNSISIDTSNSQSRLSSKSTTNTDIILDNDNAQFPDNCDSRNSKNDDD